MTPRPRTVRRLAAAAVVVLALTLSGCVRMGLELELLPDDVARPSLVLGIEDQVLETTGRSADGVIDTLVRGNDPAETAIRVEDWNGDGYTGERYVYGEMNTGQVGAATALPVNVVREGDEYVVTGTLDLTREGLGLPGQGSLDDLDVVLDVAFPGPVTESNGTISGNTVHWDPPLGDLYEIHARGSALDPSVPSPTPATDGTAAPPGASSGGVPDWLVGLIGIGGLVILLLLAIVVWQALRVRKRDDDAPPGGPHAQQYAPHPYPQHPYPRQPYAQPPHPGTAPPGPPPSIPPRE